MRRALVTLAALTAIGLAASSTFAARPGGWGQPSLTRQFTTHGTCPAGVEQQTPGGRTQADPALVVCNTERVCAWGADDLFAGFLTGRGIASGATATATYCLIADWSGHLLGVRRSTSEIDVALTVDGVLTYSIAGDRLCVIGPDYEREYGLPGVDGSNGGVGIQHAVRITATAHPAKGRWVQQAGVTFVVKPGSYVDVRNEWCPGPLVDGGAWPGPQWKVAF